MRCDALRSSQLAALGPFQPQSGNQDWGLADIAFAFATRLSRAPAPAIDAASVCKARHCVPLHLPDPPPQVPHCRPACGGLAGKTRWGHPLHIDGFPSKRCAPCAGAGAGGVLRVMVLSVVLYGGVFAQHAHSAGTARAQCAHSANYYGDYPGNSPENHPPAESCTTNSNLKNSNI